MRNHRQRSIAAYAGVVLAALMTAWPAAAADSDLQRQLQQRDQQQMELRLRMQQQLDRSSRPPQTPSADLQMRTFERDQQQRLQQFGDQQLRGAVPQGALGNAEQVRRDFERQRALSAGGLQSSPFGSIQSSPFGGQSSPFGGQSSPFGGQSSPFGTQRQIDTPSGGNGP